jgi:ketosteroid isomerase-like protein
MSQQNVELVLNAAFEAVNRGDVDAFAACFHPDVEWEVSGERFPGFEGTYHGREGVRRWLVQALEPWDSVRVDGGEITELKDGWLVVDVLMTTRGGGSGVETQLRMWQLFLVDGGQITKRTGPYWTRDAALGAAVSLLT